MAQKFISSQKDVQKSIWEKNEDLKNKSQT